MEAVCPSSVLQEITRCGTDIPTLLHDLYERALLWRVGEAAGRRIDPRCGPIPSFLRPDRRDDGQPVLAVRPGAKSITPVSMTSPGACQRSAVD
ncbi:MAG: hypothetical protein JXA89_13905 [Anaerolineae bacterium]|nr:hypothetical protein [Anaerolineae bacterium]